MEHKLKQYYQLKQRQKDIEQELAELRGQILQQCEEQAVVELEEGGYRAKLVVQERKEYDDMKLYEALPDLELWKLMSKADSSKIAGLVKLKVIPEERIRDTYAVKQVTLLQVEKK